MSGAILQVYHEIRLLIQDYSIMLSERDYSCLYSVLLLLRESRDWYNFYLYSFFLCRTKVLKRLLATAKFIYLNCMERRVSHSINTCRLPLQLDLDLVSLIFSMKMTSNDFRFATIWLAGKSMGLQIEVVLSVTSMEWLFSLPPSISKAHILNVMNLGDSTAVAFGV